MTVWDPEPTADGQEMLRARWWLNGTCGERVRKVLVFATGKGWRQRVKNYLAQNKRNGKDPHTVEQLAAAMHIDPGNLKKRGSAGALASNHLIATGLLDVYLSANVLGVASTALVPDDCEVLATACRHLCSGPTMHVEFEVSDIQARAYAFYRLWSRSADQECDAKALDLVRERLGIPSAAETMQAIVHVANRLGQQLHSV